MNKAVTPGNSAVVVFQMRPAFQDVNSLFLGMQHKLFFISTDGLHINFKN